MASFVSAHTRPHDPPRLPGEGDEEEGEEEEERYDFGMPLPDVGSGEEDNAGNRPEFSSRYRTRVDERETTIVEETVVDHPGPSHAEVQSLGPIEELENGMFSQEEREVPAGSGILKQVIVCNFCATEFAYNLRDLHDHKSVCSAYSANHNTVREVVSMPADDDTEVVKDVELVRMTDDVDEVDEQDVDGPDAPVVDGGDDEDDKAEDEEGIDSVPAGEEEDAEETLLLDEDASAALRPDRIEMPREEDEPRVTLKVAKPKPADTTVATSEDIAGDVEIEGKSTEHRGSESEGDDSTKPSVADRGDTEGADQVSTSTASPPSSRDDATYRIFRDESGEHAECRQCGKICSNRGSVKTLHRKKCPAPPKKPRDAASDDNVQTITPKKKPTKRRLSVQYEHDDDATSQANESDAESRPGSPPLRRSKRFRAEGKLDAKLKPAGESETAETTTESTNATTEALVAKKPVPTAKAAADEDDDSTLDQFDLMNGGKRMTCQHCHVAIRYSYSDAVKHLEECGTYKATVESNGAPALHSKSTKPSTSKRGKATITDKDSARAITSEASTGRTSFQTLMRHPERLSVADILEANHDVGFKWILGSEVMAEQLQRCFGAQQLVARTPPARFKVLESAMAGFNVKHLLALTTQPDDITAVVPNASGGANKARVLQRLGAHGALTLYETGSALMFRAPVIVARMFVPHLAAKLDCGPLVSPEMHEVKVVCGVGPLALQAQYHATDMVAVCLRGKALWKVKRSPVKAPPRGFNTTVTDATQTMRDVKMQAAALGVGSGVTTLQPPSDGNMFDFSNYGDEDMDDDDEGIAQDDYDEPPPAQIVGDAGSVIYLPAGTWYSVKGVEGDPMWLQIHLKTTTLGDYLADVVRQLLWSESKWREPLLRASDSGTVQQRILNAAREFAAGFVALSSGEIAPDLLVGTADAAPVALRTNSSADVATKAYEYDLTDRDGFKGGTSLQVFKGSMFRVNPLAVLVSLDELPDTCKETISSELAALVAASASMPSTTPKKALNRKGKRAIGGAAAGGSSYLGPHGGVLALGAGSMNGSAGDQRPKGLYMLHFGFGNAGLCSRLVVTFRCSPVQQAVVNWIRSRDTKEAFHMMEVAKVLAHHQGGDEDKELLKMLLRFLFAIGYIANANVPY